MKWFFSHLLLPILFAAAGFFFHPLWAIVGFILGFVSNHIICKSVPAHKRKLYVDSWVSHTNVRYMGVRSDFLWYRGRHISKMRSGTSKKDWEEWIKIEVEKSKRPKKEQLKDKYSYMPPDSSEEVKLDLEQDTERVKQIAAQYNIKGGDALAKIEEIRKKTYDEPPAKPMVNPPVVTSVTEHMVEFTQDGRKKWRSRKGFKKQYGEPVLSKLAPEPAKKVAKKAGRKAKA